MNEAPSVFLKDLANLYTLVGWAEETQLHGTFSERHPNLGKMRNCWKCGRRRREFGPVCCNIEYAKYADGTDRIVDNLFSKSFMGRFTHKKHGQTRAFKIRELTYLFQQNEKLLESAVKEINVKKPDLAGIPAFAEKYWYWKNERRDKVIRNQQKLSRRINAT